MDVGDDFFCIVETARHEAIFFRCKMFEKNVIEAATSARHFSSF